MSQTIKSRDMGIGSHVLFLRHRPRGCCIRGFGPFVMILAKQSISEPFVPQHIYDHIQMNQPTTRFGEPSIQRVPFSSYSPDFANFHGLDESCSLEVTPTCLRALYGVYDTKAHPDPQNKLGLSGFQD